MFKTFLTIFITLGLFSTLVFSRDYNYTEGWQMKGFGGYNSDISPEKLLFDNSHIKYIWAYQNKEWHRSYIHELGSDTSEIPGISSIKNNEGFWIKSDRSGTLSMPDANFKTLLTASRTLKSGWNMYGYEWDISYISFNNPHIKIVWSYNNSTKSWKAYSADKDIANLIKESGIDFITNISQNEGFWIYADAPTQFQIISPNAPHLKNTALNVKEGSTKDQMIGYINFADNFSGNINGFALLGDQNDTFKLSTTKALILEKPNNIDSTSKAIYTFKVQAHSDKGDSNIANLYVYVTPKAIQHITLSDKRKYDFMGDVLAFNDDKLFAGVYKADANAHSDVGKVYRFTNLAQTNYSENSYTEDYPSTYDHFGESFALKGDYLAVGVPGKRSSPYSQAGVVVVGKIKADGSFINVVQLYPDSTFTNQGFGQSVAMSDKNLLIGSKSIQDPSVYWYQKNSYGYFGYKEQIKPLDDTNSTEFGKQIAISGDYFAISSPNNNKVYFYKFTSDGYKLLDIIQKENSFAYKIAMDKSYLAIGEVGGKSVYLYKIVDDNLSKIATITPNIDTTSFGTNSLALKNGYLAIGETDNTQDSCLAMNESGGNIYLYVIDNNDTISLKDRYKECVRGYGEGVALGKSYLAVGAIYEASYINDTYVNATGAIYLYDLFPDLPKILNLPQNITYRDGSDKTDIFQFQTNKPVTYTLGGEYANLFDINQSTNTIMAKKDLIYLEDNNTFPITITIKSEDNKTKTYQTSVLLLPMLFHEKEYKRVKSPYTGRIWLDRNIGATEVCDSNKDDMSGCYGYYFQWGRGFDGHEQKNSATTSIRVSDLNNSGDKFIIGSVDWVAHNIDNNGSIREKRWGTLDGSSVCPLGFRVPTMAEFKAETTENNESIKNMEDAQNSFLKLPPSGDRQNQDGSISSDNYNMTWTLDNSSTDEYAYTLHLGYNYANFIIKDKASGLPLRCIKGDLPKFVWNSINDGLENVSIDAHPHITLDRKLPENYTSKVKCILKRVINDNLVNISLTFGTDYFDVYPNYNLRSNETYNLSCAIYDDFGNSHRASWTFTTANE